MPAAIAINIGPMMPNNVRIAMSIPFPALLFGSPKHVAQAIIILGRNRIPSEIIFVGNKGLIIEFGIF
jgi:hypothetical protein